jgi:hypothetical protein
MAQAAKCSLTSVNGKYEIFGSNSSIAEREKETYTHMSERERERERERETEPCNQLMRLQI